MKFLVDIVAVAATKMNVGTFEKAGFIKFLMLST
jgi:hypothetical protein